MTERYPVRVWTCKCTREGTRYHADGVKLCFLCGAVNPNPPRVSRPVAATAANGGPSAHDTAVSRSPGRPAPKTAKQGSAARPRMNKTEARYETLLSHVPLTVSVRFQPVRLFLANGHAYRPDFMTKDINGNLAAHEVKGAFIRSRDSRILFDQARQEFGWMIRYWVWAQWKNGKWHEEKP